MAPNRNRYERGHTVVKPKNFSDKYRKPRMRRKLSVPNTFSLEIAPNMPRTAAGHHKCNDDIRAKQTRKYPGVQELKAATACSQQKQGRNVERKKRATKKKRLTTFQRWSQILCVRKKGIKQFNDMLNKDKSEVAEDCYAME